MLFAMCAHGSSIQKTATMDIGAWVLMQELAEAYACEVDQMFRHTLAAERGYFELAAYHQPDALPVGGALLCWSVATREPECRNGFFTLDRRGCVIGPATFCGEACHCLCHPMYDDVETLLWEGIRPGSRGDAHNSTMWGLNGGRLRLVVLVHIVGLVQRRRRDGARARRKGPQDSSSSSRIQTRSGRTGRWMTPFAS